MKLIILIGLLALFPCFLEAKDCVPGQGCTTIITEANSACTLAGCLSTPLPSGTGTVSVTITGTMSATMQFEQSSNNGVTWTAATGSPQPSGAGVTSTTSAGLWVFSVSSRTNFRVRCSAYTSGRPTATITYSSASGGATTSAQVVSLFTGCSGTYYLGADGACHAASGTPAFSAITTGTNTTALHMGTGGSLDATGTGTIVATSVISPTTSVAALLSMGQGTAPALGANALNIYAPASITTGFGWVLPSAENAAAGVLKLGAASSHISTASVAPLFGSSPGADIVTTAAGADPATNNCVKWVAGGGVGDSGAACGGAAASPAFQNSLTLTGAGGAYGTAVAQNHIRLLSILIPHAVTTVAKSIGYYVATTDNSANNYDFGLYGPGCLGGALNIPLVAHTGTLAGTTFAEAGGVHSGSFTTTAVATPGWYCLAFTSDAASPTFQLGVTTTTQESTLIMFAPADATGGGATLPATITAPTTAATLNYEPYFFMY